MAAELAGLLQLMVAMLSSVWAVLPVALAVALGTWLWFNRGSEQERPESGEGAGLQGASPEDIDGGRGNSSPEDTEGRRPEDSADKIPGAEKDDVPEIKRTELRVSLQQSPVEQKAAPSMAEDISVAMVKNPTQTDFGPVLSNKQDLPDSRQTQNICENNQIQTLLVTRSTNIGQAIVHNASITEECNYEEVYVSETESSVNIEKVHEQSNHKDEAFDLVSAVDQKFKGTGCLSNCKMTDTNICESNADMPNELKCIQTEMERGDRKIFQEQVIADSERTNVSSEPENIARKVAAVSPLPLNNVFVSFNVHYITCSNSQILAVIGNHECLGQWENYVPLKPNKDGFWSNSILLPMNSRIEWKYVMVEDGKIRRWEECLNRVLETGHEDFEIYQCWGYH
ncbi:starch-binding domain-containing protein 1 [Heterodontus francisci]|uniref:starch-binding domain-containing protein 1 n=1 Tax=Heterodontus francisci TaxID=7792 RepID=UPI00355B9389